MDAFTKAQLATLRAQLALLERWEAMTPAERTQSRVIMEKRIKHIEAGWYLLDDSKQPIHPLHQTTNRT